jgi:hypothetical protein
MEIGNQTICQFKVKAWHYKHIGVSDDVIVQRFI